MRYSSLSEPPLLLSETSLTFPSPSLKFPLSVALVFPVIFCSMVDEDRRTGDSDKSRDARLGPFPSDESPPYTPHYRPMF